MLGDIRLWAGPQRDIFSLRETSPTNPKSITVCDELLCEGAFLLGFADALKGYHAQRYFAPVQEYLAHENHPTH